MVLKSLEKHRVCFGNASPPFADRATSAQTYSFGEFPLVLLLTLRKFSFCSHSVVHDFLLLFCCYCSTLQHCFPLNVRKLYSQSLTLLPCEYPSCAPLIAHVQPCAHPNCAGTIATLNHSCHTTHNAYMLVRILCLT